MFSLKKPITDGFSDEDGSDFRIICYDDAGISRTFHVHKVVLNEQQYFANMFRQNYQEVQDGFLELEGCVPEHFQIFLQYLYGKTMEDVEKDLKRDGKQEARLALEPLAERLVGWLTDPEEEKELFVEQALQPTADLPMEKRELADAKMKKLRHAEESIQLASLRYRAPPCALAYWHSQMFYSHIGTYVLADRLQVEEIRKKMFHRAQELLFDCWNSPYVMAALDHLFSNTSQHDDLRVFVWGELNARVDALFDEPAFLAFNNKHREFSDTMLAATAKSVEYAASNYQQRRNYCPSYKCRQNRPIRRELVSKNGSGPHSEVWATYCQQCGRKVKSRCFRLEQPWSSDTLEEERKRDEEDEGDGEDDADDSE